MRLVVADTSPVRYLLQINQISILPRLFEKIFIPTIVRDELRHASTPAAVRNWMERPPTWLEVIAASPTDDPALQGLDQGESAAIALSLDIHADLLLMDDREGVAIALQKGLEVTGTLGILDLAGRKRLIDLPQALAQLQSTNFRASPQLIQALLAQHRNSSRR